MKATLEDPRKDVEEVWELSLDEVKALPGFLGKIAYPFVKENGFYSFNNTTTGKRTLIRKK